MRREANSARERRTIPLRQPSQNTALPYPSSLWLNSMNQIHRLVVSQGCRNIEPAQAVQRYGRDRGDGERQCSRIAGPHVIGDPLSHLALQPDAAALATELEQQAFLGLVQMRQKILRDGDAAAPAILDRFCLLYTSPSPRD